MKYFTLALMIFLVFIISCKKSATTSSTNLDLETILKAGNGKWNYIETDGIDTSITELPITFYSNGLGIYEGRDGTEGTLITTDSFAWMANKTSLVKNDYTGNKDGLRLDVINMSSTKIEFKVLWENYYFLLYK
jgi:hypothetical protein